MDAGERLERIYGLAWAAYADPEPAMKAASEIRDRAFGPRITYSRSVTVPLTRLCRDDCGYCTFARPPRPGENAYLSPDEVLEIARAGAAVGCKEALFTLGDKPEKHYVEARRELRGMGFSTTVEYLAYCCKLVLEETGLLPHANPGVLSRDEVRELGHVSVSQGIMLEQSTDRLLGPNLAHWASPDKVPAKRLKTMQDAGRLGVPLTTGVLVGIGETVEERVDTLLEIRAVHEGHGNVQACVVQDFRARPGTRMADRPEPAQDEMLATIALARLLLPSDVAIQAPPKFSGRTDGDAPSYARYVDAGVNDWGGVSPDHADPERPWPHLERLERVTEDRGYLLLERLAIHPSYARDAGSWVDERLRPGVLAAQDAEGFARVEDWAAGGAGPAPARAEEEIHGRGPSKTRPPFARALAAVGSRDLREGEIALLFTARGTELSELCRVADDLRRDVNGDEVTHVANRSINYTNQCYFRCRFCAFSKGPESLNLRGDPYLLDPAEVAGRAREAWENGATEVRLQGGIHGQFTGRTYLEYLRAVKDEVPGMHAHAFTPLEVTQGARTMGLSIEAFLKDLKHEGLGTLQGMAAEVLDDEVRAVICPDKINTGEWADVMRAAHATGLRSSSTIMFGHADGPENWARHLTVLRGVQAETGGFTEFVPLPFVHADAPLYLQGRSRRGPTFAEAVKMHAVGRLALHGYIDNVQVGWVEMGVDGARACLEAGCNDVGGTPVDDGPETMPAELEAMIRGIGRTPRRRTTLYGVPHREHSVG